jgi:hypothetical protein
MSFQTDSMIPIGSLQPSSNNFPTSNDQVNQQQQQQQQQSYAGLPHAPTAQQAKHLGPVVPSEAQSPINPALMTQAPAPIPQQQRPDPFGATPFLPPPPSKSKQGHQGRYAFPPGDQQQGMKIGGGSIHNDDKYAAFEFLATTNNNVQPQHSSGTPQVSSQQNQGGD